MGKVLNNNELATRYNPVYAKHTGIPVISFREGVKANSDRPRSGAGDDGRPKPMERNFEKRNLGQIEFNQ